MRLKSWFIFLFVIMVKVLHQQRVWFFLNTWKVLRQRKAPLIKVTDGEALPAMGGPTVMGTDMRPSRKPMAWDTSLGPTSSKAMGAMMQMKQPSNSPISRHTAMRPPKMLHSGIIMDMRPMTKKDVTWRGDREEQREPFEKREL